eukprot:6156199-Pleurochrysis_carterae.AAC.1
MRARPHAYSNWAARLRLCTQRSASPCKALPALSCSASPCLHALSCSARQRVQARPCRPF